MSSKKHLIVIGGPTASGKTNVAIALARHFEVPILSADSRQLYKEMTIGTAKPTPEELARARHYFIDHLSVTQPYTVSDFEAEALALLASLFLERKVAILVGGSGLFIQAVCEGLDKFPEVPDAIFQQVQQLHQDKGLEGLQQALSEADPLYYGEVDRQNPRRLMRALSVCWSSGQPFSAFRQKRPVPRSFVCHYVALEVDRPSLYQRINRRVEEMLEAGLLEEVNSLYEYKMLPALQTVGYRELFSYLDGDISYEEAVELIKRNTRRYAKRQGTWLRRDEHWHWFDPANRNLIIDFLTQKMN